MDTPRNAFWTSAICANLAVVMIVAVPGVALAQDDDAAVIRLLKASYQPEQLRHAVRVEALIAGLRQGLGSCEDVYLAYRIKYRVGVLLFRIGNYEQAKEQFIHVTRNDKCPAVIRAAGVNMLGQMYRMEGNVEAALQHFGELVTYSQKRLSSNSVPADRAALARFCASALLAQAEMLESQEKWRDSIVPYSHLVKLLSPDYQTEQKKQLLALAHDRVAQLYFRVGDMKQYFSHIDLLTGDVATYQRAPLAAMEKAFIEFSQKVSLQIDSAMGPWDVPAQVIGKADKITNKQELERFCQTLAGLCRRYQDSPASVLLRYNYAWLLDAIGEKAKAIKAFEAIVAFGNDGKIPTGKGDLPAMIREYAKIQHAILLAENGAYTKALQSLNILDAHPEQSHLGRLAESVGKSLQTLKREVRIEENK